MICPKATYRLIERGLKTVIETYPLLTLCPSDVLAQDVHLDLLAVRYGVVAIKDDADWAEREQAGRIMRVRPNAQSCAVRAFTIDDTNPRD